MIFCVDVHYHHRITVAAAVGFADWSADTASLELVERSDAVPQAYEPGQFYKRELPFVLSLLQRAAAQAAIAAVIIDGHVWLAGGQPGLGAHLHQALPGRVPVIGIAKSAFHEGVALPVHRGMGRKPLFVTAIGMADAQAAAYVAAMHGPYRLPTLVKRADQLCRYPSPP